MPVFSNRSLQQIQTLDPQLQKVLVEAIKYTDFTVIQGYRGKTDQDAAFRNGTSKLKYPHSKHNQQPARAVDLAPWPVDWQDTARFAFLAGVICTVGKQLGITVRWGGNWKTFVDHPHFEL